MNTNYNIYYPVRERRHNWAWWWYTYIQIGVLGKVT